MTKPLTGIPADRAQSYESIENVTAALRLSLGLDPLEQLNALKFFHEDLPELELTDRGHAIRIVEGTEECPQEGLTRWDKVSQKLEVILSDETYQRLLTDHVRARSTMAHETGHAVLHTAQIIRLAGMSLISQVAFHRERTPHKAYYDTEWQANAFASSFLMPAEGIQKLVEKKNFTPAKIAALYGVSEESAGYRLDTYRRS